MVLLAALLGACTDRPTPSPPPSQPPTSLAPSSAPTASGGGASGIDVSLEPCEEVPAATAPALEYLAVAPEPPFVPGAGEDEFEMNEGGKPPTPIDPEAPIESDPNLTPSVIAASGAQDDPQPRDIVLYQAATDIPGTSNVAEPNFAVHGKSALMTWNWGAARSFDGGVTPQYLDPKLAMRGSDGVIVDGGYCCDQLAHYVADYDLWVWVLQSMTRLPRDAGGNRIRLMTAKGDAAFDHYWDLRSAPFNFSGEVWFDQPKIGISKQYLFVSVNAFGPTPPQIPGQPEPRDPYRAAVVFRIGLADLASGGGTPPACFSTIELPDALGSPMSDVVPVREAGDTMFLAAHYSNSTLAVWRWPDADARPTLHKVLQSSPEEPAAGYPFEYNNYRCPTDGVTDPTANWCGFSDDRITTGWATADSIGFAWNVTQEAVRWKYPSVWIVQIDQARLTSCLIGGCVTSKPHLRNEDFAFQYAAIAPNSHGELGMSVLYGGGALRQSCAVGGREPQLPAAAPWDLVRIAESDRHPDEPRAGDYLHVSAGPTDGSWVGACMTLQSANGLNSPGSAHFTWFGRRSDAPAN